MKVFIDANILVEILTETNEKVRLCNFMMSNLQSSSHQLFCSPTTFAITYFFFGKQVKNKELLNEKMRKFFQPFHFTREDYIIIDRVLKSKFTDLEDALRYFSAEDERVDAIVTFNKFDYPKSAIPVYLPEEFIYKYFPL